MYKKITIIALTAALATSSAMPAYAANNEVKPAQQEMKQHISKEQSEIVWTYKGVKITVSSDVPLSHADKKKYEAMTDAQLSELAPLAATKSTSPIYSVVPTAEKPPQYLPSDTGASFTLINNANKTYDNSLTYAGIYSALTSLIGYFTIPTRLAATVGGSSATGVAAQWVNNKLGVRQTVYTNVRLGISYNSYWGFYEYVESVTHFNTAYSGVLDVMYANTAIRVPDETLALYGLRNY